MFVLYFRILKWTGEGGFQQLKVLETQEPCSCILLTPHSIIVGCNKFFEIDAQDFSVEGNLILPYSFLLLLFFSGFISAFLHKMYFFLF